MFASRTITAHLLRGGIAGVLIAWALAHQSSNPALPISAIALAIVAMRGCPMCWMLGLAETIGDRIGL